MKGKVKVTVIGIAAVAALAAGGATIAGAAGSGDDHGSDDAIRGQTLDRASVAALKETGGGRVTETEVGDEEGAYEVEVTRPDGSQVDVHLGKDFNVLGSVGDDNSSGDDDASDE